MLNGFDECSRLTFDSGLLCTVPKLHSRCQTACILSGFRNIEDQCFDGSKVVPNYAFIVHYLCLSTTSYASHMTIFITSFMLYTLEISM